MVAKTLDTPQPDTRPMEEILSFIKNVANALPEEEKPFFEELAKKKQMIYDWDNDNFWVVKGGNEEDEANQLHMGGHTLRLFMFLDENDSVDVTGPNKKYDTQDSKDEAMKAFLMQGFALDIRNAKSAFASQGEINEYLERMKS